jgi:hypothetical protein
VSVYTMSPKFPPKRDAHARWASSMEKESYSRPMQSASFRSVGIHPGVHTVQLFVGMHIGYACALADQTYPPLKLSRSRFSSSPNSRLLSNSDACIARSSVKLVEISTEDQIPMAA